MVCARRYNGHELWTALGVLQEAGVEFELISSSTFIQDEVTNQPNRITRTIDNVDPSEVSTYDGLMYVSGNMKDTEAYWHNKRTLAYVSEAHKRDMPIAAICCSVPTIRGAAFGKRVSFFPLVRSRELLSRAGAILQTVACTVDGKLVTAEHQMASQMWAEAFVSVLNGGNGGINLTDSGYTPKGRERMPIPELEKLKRTTNPNYKEPLIRKRQH